MKKVCLNCARFIDKKADVCPYCGHVFTAPKKNVINVDKQQKQNTPKKKKSKTVVTVNENYGTIHISTKDSVYYSSKDYSARVARGEYKPEKLKWYEVDKWADKILTRRRINKVVNKEASKVPENLNYWAMLVLTILTGFVGLHNFYAKNYKRGIFMLCMFLFSLGIVGLVPYLPFLSYVQWSLGGGIGLIVAVMWFLDVFRVIFKKYIYQYSRIEYIKMLDTETRAKLGQKYIDLQNCGKRVKRTKEKNVQPKNGDKV